MKGYEVTQEIILNRAKEFMHGILMSFEISFINFDIQT